MNDVTVCTAAFAGFKLNLALRWLETTHWLRRFLVQNAAEGEPVCVTDRVLADWQAAGSPADAFGEFCLLCQPVSEALLMQRRCVFHAAALRFRGRAWLIAAGSGVGKSTQCRALMELCPDGISVINGDKPVLHALEDGRVMVYPSPWNGKEGWHGAEAAPLGGVIFLQRGGEDRIAPCREQDAAVCAFPLVFQSFEREAVIRMSGVMTQMIVRAGRCWRMTSNTISGSAQMLLGTLQQEAEHDI